MVRHCPIYRTVWLHTDLNIFTDAGNTVSQSGEVWGLGAYCRETGDYVSEVWHPQILQQSLSKESKNVSVPFLESMAVLTLGRPNTNIQVYTDSKPATQICNNRWSKTNDFLNNYIAYFDFQCSMNGVLLQVQSLPRDENPGAHHLSQGAINKAQRYVNLRHRVLGKKTQATLSNEVERIISEDLQPKTLECYKTAIRQYKEFMKMKNLIQAKNRYLSG